MLTIDELKQSLPATLQSAASQQMLDKINQVSTDPEYARIVRENFVTYSSVLSDGRYKLEDYLNAVSYVSFKLMGHSNKSAYQHAFPKRYQTLIAAGRNDKEISSYVANYNKNKLVNIILEQAAIAPWIMNQDVYQEAINTQFELMQTANSEKVRCEAANSILTHLKRPEAAKVEIDMTVKKDIGLEALKDSMAELAQKQLELIQQGVNTRSVAHQPLVRRDRDVEDAEIAEQSEKAEPVPMKRAAE